MTGPERVVVPFPDRDPAAAGARRDASAPETGGEPPDPRDRPEPAAPWPAPRRLGAALALAALGAGLYALHVRSTALAPLGWVSTTPWLLLAVHPRLRGRGNGWIVLASFYAAFVAAVAWLQPFGTAAWLVGVWLYVPQVMPAYWVASAVRRRWPRFPLALLWAVAFTGAEWLRVRFCPGELALALLGYSQIVLPKLVQVADLGGVAAVTFMLAAFAGLVGEVVVALGRPAADRALRPLAWQAGAVGLLVAAVVGYGFARDTEEHFSEGPRLLVVQPALPHGEDAETAWQVYDVQVVQTLSVARPGETDAVLWPENSVMLPIVWRGSGGPARLDPALASDLLPVLARLGQPLLVDGGSVDEDGVTEHHTAVLVRPDGTFDAYDKVLPLPWTEQLPAERLVSRLGDGALAAWKAFVRSFVGFVPAATPGDPDELAPMRLVGRDGRTWSFGTPICFEIGTARIVNLWHRRGVDFLVNQTSEGLLGDSVHAQTIVVSGFRAIEGRVSVVRATNDGISAVIDPNGRIREMLRGRVTGRPINEGGWLAATVVLDSRRGTFYSRFGDWLPVACLAASVALWMAARRRDAGAAVPAVPSG